MRNPIVVGTDGSPAAALAVEWAADEAERARMPLVIVHVVEPDGRHSGEGRELEVDSRSTLASAARFARKRAGLVTISTVEATGRPAPALASHASGALMLVVGSRGLGAVAGAVLGSVSRQLASHAPCPLIVVREQPNPEAAGVVVGISGEPGEDPVLEFALQEAERDEGLLRAIHTWLRPAAREPGDMLPLVYDVEGVQEEERILLGEVMGGAREAFPGVTIDEHCVHGRASNALVNASEHAGLVVVGARRGAVPILGPTASAVLHRAHCPVAVVGHG
jgi:nucleotide-binding universal stress UspA family protein